MAKMKKVKEIKPKIKIVKEIERKEGEEELEKDMDMAEDDFRREVARTSGIAATSLVLESDVGDAGSSEKTRIREETRERVQLERENEATAITYGARTGETEERAYRQYRRATGGRMQSSGGEGSMQVQRSRDWETRSNLSTPSRGLPLMKQEIGPAEIERTEEKRNYETQKERKRTYPWER